MAWVKVGEKRAKKRRRILLLFILTICETIYGQEYNQRPGILGIQGIQGYRRFNRRVGQPQEIDWDPERVRVLPPVRPNTRLQGISASAGTYFPIEDTVRETSWEPQTPYRNRKPPSLVTLNKKSPVSVDFSDNRQQQPPLRAPASNSILPVARPSPGFRVPTRNYYTPPTTTETTTERRYYPTTFERPNTVDFAKPVFNRRNDDSINLNTDYFIKSGSDYGASSSTSTPPPTSTRRFFTTKRIRRLTRIPVLVKKVAKRPIFKKTGNRTVTGTGSDKTDLCASNGLECLTEAETQSGNATKKNYVEAIFPASWAPFLDVLRGEIWVVPILVAAGFLAAVLIIFEIYLIAHTLRSRHASSRRHLFLGQVSKSLF